ncbi:hypothetical protein KAT36_04445 [Candidatus Pacearchaeota archaeon]|nr:hypothetical protein [Candidatus Pacearchaeota archaeon]
MGNKQNIYFWILVGLLIFAVGYIVVDRYFEIKSARELSVFQEGVDYGYKSAVLQIIQEVSSSCESVSVFVDNQTVNIIDVECLQKVSQAD